MRLGGKLLKWLLVFVTLFIFFNIIVPFNGQKIINKKFSTEAHYHKVFEDILVNYSTPNKQFLCSFKHIGELFCGYGVSSNINESVFSPRSYCHLALRFLPSGINWYTWYFIEKFDISGGIYYLGRCFTSINDLQFEVRHFAYLQRLNKANLVNTQICPFANMQSCFCHLSTFFSGIGGFSRNGNRILQVFRVFLGGLPQFSVSTHQSPCEHSDHSSSGSGNKSTMKLNPSTDKNGSIFKDNEERDQFSQGAFLILWIIFLIWYAWQNRLTNHLCILICFITLITYGQSRANAYDIIHTRMHISIISMSDFFKHIFIYDDPININFSSSSPQLLYFLESKEVIINNCFVGRSTNGQNTFSDMSRGFPHRKGILQWKFMDTYTCPMKHIVCGGLAGIFNFHKGNWATISSKRSWSLRTTLPVCWREWISDISYCNRTYTDICPKLSLFGDLHLRNCFSQPFRLVGHCNYLSNQCKKLTQGNSSDGSSKSYDPPILRRFLVLIFSLLVGFGISLGGVYYFINERRLLGFTLIGFGFLLYAGGMYLWWITFFPYTWSWPL